MEAGHSALPSDIGVEWLNSKGSWSFYFLVLLTSNVLVSALFPGIPLYKALSAVNIGHCLVTFFAFHWVKGIPFPTYYSMVPQNADQYTFWEQIDQRWQNTPSRKFCRVIVVALYAVAMQSTPWEKTGWQLANFIAFVVAFVAKMPAMDTVRIFGINK
mmetsp:Transcript_39288/g.96119  ORF Transcript_39288/g.96119 Transcript_39288/m.96119 type:complete len:158 (-) Transcript_39288:773-1246(-)